MEESGVLAPESGGSTGRPSDEREEAGLRTKTIATCLLLVAWAMPATANAEAEEAPELRPVLIVMDVQNEWMPRMSEEERETAPASINAAIGLFREFGHPVIHVYHSDPERGPAQGTEAFEFLDSIEVAEGDLKVVKARASAFTETELEQTLREAGHDTIFLCGLSATGCVLATYFGATDRDFMALMIEGALLSGDASRTKVVEEICYSVTLEKLREILEGD